MLSLSARLICLGRGITSIHLKIKEDTSILLGDGTTKIFLNTDGEKDDVSRELRAFLDYVAGKDSDDLFVRRLQEAIKEVRKNREWRYEYMTLLMRDQENIEKGIEQGRKQEKERNTGNNKCAKRFWTSGWGDKGGNYWKV